MGLALLIAALAALYAVIRLVRASGVLGVVALVAGTARLGAEPGDPLGAVLLAGVLIVARLALRLRR